MFYDLDSYHTNRNLRTRISFFGFSPGPSCSSSCPQSATASHHMQSLYAAWKARQSRSAWRGVSQVAIVAMAAMVVMVSLQSQTLESEKF